MRARAIQTYQGYIEDSRIIPVDMLTIEYLFKDYDGTSFQTELADLGEPAGNEKW